MRFYVAGGCGEHGRSCFLTEGQEYSILVDCGAGLGKVQPQPLLTGEQIRRIRYCFLTHSHKDHTGALDWLYENGFQGRVYLSEETREQISLNREHVHLLRAEDGPGGVKRLDHTLTVTHGRSGHCPGSFWFLLQFEGKQLFFSGDYCETSPVYRCDSISGFWGDLAVIDCAYGDREADGTELIRRIREKAEETARQKKILLLPVPALGRGADLLLTALEYEDQTGVFGDQRLTDRMNRLFDRPWWLKKEAALQKEKKWGRLEEWNGEPGFLLLSDPQLEREESRLLAERVRAMGGEILFTGHIYEDTWGDRLRKEGKAGFLRYPVHMNRKEAQAVRERNSFRKTVLTHCPFEIPAEEGVFSLKPGEWMEI